MIARPTRFGALALSIGLAGCGASANSDATGTPDGALPGLLHDAAGVTPEGGAAETQPATDAMARVDATLSPEAAPPLPLQDASGDSSAVDANSADAGPLAEAGPVPSACTSAYSVTLSDGGQAPNPSVDAVLQACPDLADALNWVDASNDDVPYASWSTAMQQRLQVLYGEMLSGAPLTDLACPDPRGADSVRVPTNEGLAGAAPEDVFFTTDQASDMFLASVAHSLALEVRGTLPWSLLGYPTAELVPLLSARSMVAPVSSAPRPFGTPLPDATYQVPASHVNSMGFVCDPRDGYDFIRGLTSVTGADLVGPSVTATLANITFFLTQNSEHGFPVTESVDTFQFALKDRLALGLLFSGDASAPAQTLVERVGCHSTAELLEELARTVDIPLDNLAADNYEWTDITDYSYRDNSHRGLAYAWTRPDEARILPHADFVNATALWPNYLVPFSAADYYDVVWQTPAAFQAMGLDIDMTLPTVAVVPANSDGSFETYFDFGQVFAVLGTAEGRYYLRTQACAWDIVDDFCTVGDGGVTAFGNDDPYGAYDEYSTPSLLQAAYTRAAACIATEPTGCASVPSAYPNLSATNWLP